MPRGLLAFAILAITGVTVLGQVGCTTKVPLTAPQPNATPVTPDSIQAIFTANCAVPGCHAQPNPEAGMDLSAGASYVALVGVPSLACVGLQRVKPFDPGNSCLIKRLTGAVSPRMPKFAAPLPDTTIAKVSSWIQGGAQGQIATP